MRKWTGGIMIITLALILMISYSFTSTMIWNKEGHNVIGSSVPDDDQERLSEYSEVVLDLVDKQIESGNSSVVDERSIRLVWDEMLNLMSKTTDPLPGMGDGIKEAANAWTELSIAIQEEKIRVSNIQNRVTGLEDKKCPFSVNLEKKNPFVNGSLLEIPCGLVEDSSITVIGIPKPDAGSFYFRLLGSKNEDKQEDSVVLHFEVRLRGDNLTEGPVIVQNTWSVENGWGREERCPDHNYGSYNLTVDGLHVCSEQPGEPSNLRNTTRGRPASTKSLNVSDASFDKQMNFPFVEGHPFTATLWVGIEGLHITVNGRPITSFGYRKSFEPWLVSGIQIVGGVDVLSTLANGLPMSEDWDDVEYLKAPPLSRRKVKLVVGIFSTGNNFQRRMAVRRTWMQYECIRAGEVAVRFFVGLHKNMLVNLELWKEAKAYRDIQIMPFVDYYSLITLKTVAVCILGMKYVPARYIMKTDDDAFVRIDEVLSNIQQKRISAGLLYGKLSYDSEPHRDKDDKWFVSNEEWPHSKYPPWAHGPGYVVSRDIAEFVVRGHLEGKLKLFKLEDVAMGIWIEEFKKIGHNVHYVSDDRFHNTGCETNYILAHYQGPRLLLCLWQRLQQDHKPICCE